MKKLFSIATIGLLAITLSACSSDNSSSSKDSSSKSSSSAQSVKKAASPVTLDKYKSIKLGLDSSISTNDGETTKQVKSKLGKPSSITKTDTNGKKTTTYTWNDLNSSFKAKNVTVSFEGGKAVAKGYANLAADQIKPLDKKKVNSIQKGASYDDVVNKLGMPTAETEGGQGSIAIKGIMYLTDTKGGATSFSFMGDKVIDITSGSIK